jgi:omega-amidase
LTQTSHEDCSSSNFLRSRRSWGEPKQDSGVFCARAKDAGADLIVFPEMVDTGYSMPVIRKAATAWSHGAVPALQELAETLSLTIISGVSERDGSCIYNSQVFIDAQGKIIAKYRKTHLFACAPIEEDKCFTPGSELTSSTIDDLCFGLTICYDLRFPEVYRRLAVEGGANVFIISSAWPFPRLEHLRVLAIARAIRKPKLRHSFKSHRHR